MEDYRMKKRILESSFFVVLVFGLMSLFVLSGSAKTVKKDGFVFDVQKKEASVVSYSGKDERVSVPSSVSSVPVTKIGRGCFSNATKLKEISLPSTVTAIENAAFGGCSSLSSFTAPKNLKTIGESAFWYCTSLKKVVFYSDINSIGENAFRGCESLTVYAPDGSYAASRVKELGVKTVLSTYTTSLTVSKSVKLTVGQTKKLSVKALPENRLDKKLKFSSSDKKVVTVSSSGVLTAVSCGEAKITVSARDKSGKKAICLVKVSPKKPTSVRESASTLSSVTVRWNKSVGATGYEVFVIDKKSGKATLAAETKKTAFTLSGLKSGESVKLKIRSVYKNKKTVLKSSYSSFTAKAATAEAVRGLRQEQQSLSSVRVLWNSLSGAKEYRVYKFDEAKKNWKLVLTTKKTAFILKGLSPTKTVKILVRAVFENGKKTVLGKRAYLTVFSASTETKNLRQTASTPFSASFSWNKTDGAKEYRVFKYNESGKKWVLLESTKKTSFTLSSLAPSGEYRVRVQSVLSVDGKTISGDYSSLSVKTAELPAVSSLNAESGGTDAVSLNWKKVNGASGYNIYSVNAESGEYSLVASSKEPSYVLGELSPATKYGFSVKAFFLDGKKKIESKKFSTTAFTFTAPEIVSNLIENNRTPAYSSVTFLWFGVENASGYSLEKREKGSEKWDVITLKNDRTTATVDGLSPEKEYEFRICAFVTDGEKTVFGEYSPVVTAKPMLLPETKRQALFGFATALALTGEQKDFTLVKDVNLSEKRFLPDEEKVANLLSSVDNEGRTFYNFKNGEEISSGLSLSDVVSFLKNPLSISEEDEEKIEVAFERDGSSGYSISLTLTPEGRNSSLASSLAPLPDWNAIAKERGVKFESVKYGSVTLSGKINAGKIDFLNVSYSFSAAGETEDKTSFTFGETVDSSYTFLWN